MEKAKVICTKTGGCEAMPSCLSIQGPNACPYYVRTGLAEVIDWRERYEELAQQYRALQEAMAGVVWVGDSVEQTPSPGPEYSRVREHWARRRRSKAPETAPDSIDLGTGSDPAIPPAQTKAEGQPEPFRDGVTLWYCEVCGKPTDIYPCRVCDCWPRLSPEAAELVRQGLEDGVEGRVSEVGHRYGSLGEESENPYPAQTEERSE